MSGDMTYRHLGRSGRRDDIVLAIKVYQPMGSGPNDRRLSAYHLRRACEASLRRLQTDHIDLYQMHHVDRATRGKRSGRPWSSWCRKARSATSAAATSPAGTSPQPKG
jgi:aryl-alcohol dehydrogenase-like predicted oxidoreductase